MAEIKYSCGFCGQPMDKDLNDITDISSGYDPNDYPHDVCATCHYEETRKADRMLVTREMALDAGMPELEGEYF